MQHWQNFVRIVWFLEGGCFVIRGPLCWLGTKPECDWLALASTNKWFAVFLDMIKGGQNWMEFLVWVLCHWRTIFCTWKWVWISLVDACTEKWKLYSNVKCKAKWGWLYNIWIGKKVCDIFVHVFGNFWNVNFKYEWAVIEIQSIIV